jgi:predicted CopG family antitoxin
MHEAMKTITLRDDTYHSLVILKEGDDSFSDVIDRLISRKNRDIREYAGALRNSSILDELNTFTRKMRSSGRARI